MNKGFTFIEMVLVVTITATLIGLSTFNLINFQQRSLLANTQTSLISDIKLQQLKAMNTESIDAVIEPYGIRFGTHEYTAFKGTTYNPADELNFTVALEEGLSFSEVEFADNQVVFLPGSGEIANYASNQNTITIAHDGSDETQQITLNSLGVVTSIVEVRN